MPQFKDYVTTVVIHRHGLRIEPGTPLRLSDPEAKYQRHALAELTDEVPAHALAEFERLEAEGPAAGEVAPSVEPTPPAAAPAASKSTRKSKPAEAADGRE